jgi:HlyD family secretion protein
VTQVRQAPEAVQNVVTYDVVVTVPNPELLLKPGMTANVRIVVDEREDVLRVPDQALRYTPGGVSGQDASAGAAARPSGGLLGLGRISGRGAGRAGGANGRGGQREERPGGTGEAQTSAGHVYVLRDGQPVAISVTTGLDDDTMSEVLQGEIEEGEQVVVSETRGDAKPSAPQTGGR